MGVRKKWCEKNSVVVKLIGQTVRQHLTINNYNVTSKTSQNSPKRIEWFNVTLQYLLKIVYIIYLFSFTYSSMSSVTILVTLLFCFNAMIWSSSFRSLSMRVWIKVSLIIPTPYDLVFTCSIIIMLVSYIFVFMFHVN